MNYREASPIGLFSPAVGVVIDVVLWWWLSSPHTSKLEGIKADPIGVGECGTSLSPQRKSNGCRESGWAGWAMAIYMQSIPRKHATDYFVGVFSCACGRRYRPRLLLYHGMCLHLCMLFGDR